MLCTLASSEAPLLPTTMLLPEAVGSLNQPAAPLAVASVAALHVGAGRLAGRWREAGEQRLGGSEVVGLGGRAHNPVHIIGASKMGLCMWRCASVPAACSKEWAA